MSKRVSVLGPIMGQPDQWGCAAGAGLHQDVACTTEQRAAGVTSVTPGRKGLSTSYANWRLAGAERGSAELRGTLAQSHRSLLPLLKLPSLASPGPLPHLPATAECSPCFPPPCVVICVCVCVCACAGMPLPPRLGPVCECVFVCVRTRVRVCVCLSGMMPPLV